MVSRRLCLLLLLAPTLSCHSPDPQAVLEVTDVEAYWAVDPPSGDTRYIAPAVRLHVRNKGAEPLRSVQATATFRRKGEAQTWGSDWQQVSTSAHPLAPGHQLFKDARVEIFFRVGASAWSKFADADVARHIGSRTIQEAAAPVSPGAASPASR